MHQTIRYHSKNALSPSKEEYLKAIYVLSEKTQVIRSIDLATYLNVSKPSVSNAVTILQNKGLVVKPLHGGIHLTSEGLKLGQSLTDRFQLIKQFLITCCNVNEQTASEDACKMEHLISDETTFALKQYFNPKR